MPLYVYVLAAPLLVKGKTKSISLGCLERLLFLLVVVKEICSRERRQEEEVEEETLLIHRLLDSSIEMDAHRSHTSIRVVEETS